nr:PREDICTED: toll-like receptor 2 [Lepisosteus oculatus]XP_015200206.1 PREDICTED: toll-like receptor 2 [Lepisosteus oculatus]
MGVLFIKLCKLFLVCLFTGYSAICGRHNCHLCDERSICDCSAEELLQVPNLPMKNILVLNLSFNNIEIVTETDFKVWTELKALSLQNNKIHSIHEKAFRFPKKLEYLDLSYNQLGNLSPSWFNDLVLLQHLNILGNIYRTLGQGFIFQSLGGLKSLKFGNPSFKAISNKDFVGIQKLDDMELHGSHLKEYEKGSFRHIKHISHAILSIHGPFENDGVLIRKMLKDLSNCTTHLELKDIELTLPNSVQSFSEICHAGVKKLTFRNVSLSDEAVDDFITVTINSGLSYLGIEDSRLSGKGAWKKASKIKPALKALKLEAVNIKNLEITNFYAFTSFLDFRNYLHSLKRVTIIDSKVFLIPCLTSQSFQSLEYLDLSGNLLTDYAMKESACHGNGTWKNLQYLNLSKNSLKFLGQLSQLLTNLNKLVSLDISQNTFFDVPESCNWPPNLQYLNLSTSKIQLLTPSIPQSLHILDLSNNDLTVFTVKLPLLKELYVSGNKFMQMPDGRLVPSLEVLSITGNKLNTLNMKNIKAFEKLALLEAGNNKYVCSCEFVPFMQKDITHMVKLNDSRQDYVCDSPSVMKGLLVWDIHHSVFECHMMISLAVMCTGILFVFFIIVILCYKFHVLWYLRMTWAWIQAKRKPTTRVNNIYYDAFISYSERDSEWVENYLVNELESTQPPFRLCLHKRDFLPGKWIMDNIINSIEQSQKTLFVLSKHFVSSEWCRYELDFSHFRLFDENNDTAILILLEPIPKETIPKRFCKLRKLMNSQTYLEWPEDEALQPIFWHNLKLAIKREEFNLR